MKQLGLGLIVFGFGLAIGFRFHLKGPIWDAIWLVVGLVAMALTPPFRSSQTLGLHWKLALVYSFAATLFMSALLIAGISGLEFAYALATTLILAGLLAIVFDWLDHRASNPK